MPDPHGPHRSCQVELPRAPRAAGLARGHVRELLGDAFPADRCDLAQLAVSELVTNAVRHGEGAIRLRLRHDGCCLRGEVIDEGGGFEPELHEPPADQPHGRGLLIVAALSDRWGVHEGTTHVWFELDARAEDHEDPVPPELGAARRPPELD